MIPAPVSLTEDPRQHVHLVVKLWGELCTDEVRRTGPLAASDQPGVFVIAAMLGGQRGAVQGEHGAQAEMGSRLINVQPFLGPAGIPPAKVFALLLISQVHSTVHGFQRVGAGTAGQV